MPPGNSYSLNKDLIITEIDNFIVKCLLYRERSSYVINRTKKKKLSEVSYKKKILKIKKEI